MERCASTVSTGVQKVVSDPLVLAGVIGSCESSDMGAVTELRSSAGAASALNH